MSTQYYNIIAEHISTRHWIAVDSGPGIHWQLVYVCMYVRHAFGMQLRLGAGVSPFVSASV